MDIPLPPLYDAHYNACFYIWLVLFLLIFTKNFAQPATLWILCQMYDILQVKYTHTDKKEVKQMEKLLKGGLVVSGQSVQQADVLLDGQKICAVGEHLSSDRGAVSYTHLTLPTKLEV